MGALNINETTFNLRPLFDGDDDPRMAEKRKAVEEASYAFINKWKNRRDYLEKPEVLKEALDEYEVWQRNSGTDGDEGYYFWLRTQQDENDPKLKAKFNKIRDFAVKIQNDIQFFELGLVKIPPERQASFLRHEGLAPYRHFLERSFAWAKYVLSEPEEKIINLKSAPAHANWVKMISGFLSKEERGVLTESGNVEKKSFSEVMSLIDSRSKAARDSAAEGLNDILAKHVDAAEAEINSVLQDKKADDQLRGAERPDLLRHIGDDIESEAVDALVCAVGAKFDLAKRYYALKAKLLGVPKLAYHERNVPYGAIDKKYQFGEAAELVYGVLGGLDGQFADIFKGFAENGQLDVFPQKDKRHGAFCSHNLLSQPTYVFLNHTDKLNDVLTLAHELGHGINNELMRRKQNALNFGTPLSTAEVASTFMEDFVLQEIERSADDRLRLALMMMKLNDDVSTIFRQVACYNFEKELHAAFREKGYLSKEEIGAIFQKHMASYMGEAVEQSPGSENWWVYWGHIRTFFYVYSYASSLLISKSLQNSVKRDHGFIGKVKEFLSAGMSDSPKNIFARLGVNIGDKSFWQKGLNEVENLLADAEKLAAELGKA